MEVDAFTSRLGPEPSHRFDPLADYLALARPTYEQRFQFQRLLHQRGQMLNFHSSGTFGWKFDSNPIRFSSWKSDRRFRLETYAYAGNVVHLRGICFHTGDILLCNRASASDGIFTTLAEGRQSFAHVAVYALLRDSQGLYPAALEIHREGVRAVPLKVFLDDNFHAYLEVFRANEVGSECHSRIVDVGLQMLTETHGFDIDMDQTQDVYVSCALMAAQLYRRAGLTPARPGSRYNPSVMPNLEILGNTSSANRDLLMPDDYSRDPRFSLVGLVDNGRFFDLLARGLVRERMQEVWQTMVLEPARFPFGHALMRFTVRHLQRQTWPLAHLLAPRMGFKTDSFPSGPTTFIALVPTVEARIEKATSTIAAGFRAYEGEVLGLPSARSIANHPSIQQLVCAAMAEFESLFRARTRPLE